MAGNVCNRIGQSIVGMNYHPWDCFGHNNLNPVRRSFAPGVADGMGLSGECPRPLSNWVTVSGNDGAQRVSFEYRSQWRSTSGTADHRHSQLCPPGGTVWMSLCRMVRP